MSLERPFLLCPGDSSFLRGPPPISPPHHHVLSLLLHVQPLLPHSVAWVSRGLWDPEGAAGTAGWAPLCSWLLVRRLLRSRSLEKLLGARARCPFGSQVSFWDWLRFGPKPGEVNAQASESASMGSSPDSEETGCQGSPGGCCVQGEYRCLPMEREPVIRGWDLIAVLHCGIGCFCWQQHVIIGLLPGRDLPFLFLLNPVSGFSNLSTDSRRKQ